MSMAKGDLLEFRQLYTCSVTCFKHVSTWFIIIIINTDDQIRPNIAGKETRWMFKGREPVDAEWKTMPAWITPFTVSPPTRGRSQNSQRKRKQLNLGEQFNHTHVARGTGVPLTSVRCCRLRWTVWNFSGRRQRKHECNNDAFLQLLPEHEHLWLVSPKLQSHHSRDHVFILCHHWNNTNYGKKIEIHVHNMPFLNLSHLLTD